MPKIKPGDTYLFRATVRLVSDDLRSVTVRIPGYDYPVTLSVDDLERHEKTGDVINEQALGRKR